MFILGVTAYLDTALIENDEPATFLTNMSVNDEIEETSGTGEQADEEVKLPIPTLEYRLIDTKLTEDGFLLETYREYEIYEDELGNTIKSVPTANYEYIRYRQ